ncbi:MAG TPA: aminotransferase class V-fold PLP-dependent enzyme [Caulobacterales bacterium]|nr:aminotransferase class V-fold PLP-dependent enzyme [Caulobacterales bacterium]
MSGASYKRLFSRALAAAPRRLHFAAHSHHLWPDASYHAHLAAWEDAARLADKKWDKVFGEVIPEAQRNIAQELNLPDPNTIGFAPSTHELLTRIFSARGGTRLKVLCSDGEFHSFRRQAARWVEANSIVLNIVPVAPMDTFAQRFLAAMGETHPDIAFVSHVMFKTGLVFDGVAELAACAKPDGPWVVIDGYHSFMAMSVDLSGVADRIFFLGGGYKYAMAGEGAAYLHAPPGFAPRPANTGWFAEFGALESKPGGVGYAPGGMRFMGATYDPSGLYRFNAARAMLRTENLATANITSRIAALRSSLVRRIRDGEAGLLAEAELIAPTRAPVQQRFIALRDKRATEWKAKLMAADVIVDARDDVLRIGLGLYTDAEDIAALCEKTRQVLA